MHDRTRPRPAPAQLIVEAFNVTLNITLVAGILIISITGMAAEMGRYVRSHTHAVTRL